MRDMLDNDEPYPLPRGQPNSNVSEPISMMLSVTKRIRRRCSSTPEQRSFESSVTPILGCGGPYFRAGTDGKEEDARSNPTFAASPSSGSEHRGPGSLFRTMKPGTRQRAGQANL